MVSAGDSNVRATSYRILSASAENLAAIFPKSNRGALHLPRPALRKHRGLKRAMKKYLDDKLNYVSDVLAKTYNEIEANKKSI